MRNARLAVALLPAAGVLLAACATTTRDTAVPTETSATPTMIASPSPVATSVATADSTVPQTGSPTPAPPCQPETLRAEPASKAESGQGKTFDVTTAVKNTGRQPCSITGFPTVAVTGLPPADPANWPRKQLTVIPEGNASPMTLAPGDRAQVTLTFTSCTPGTTPTEGPILLLGVPNGGIELTMADGSDFVLCGDVVTVTPFKPRLS
jgi:hypothetical protein